MPALGAYKLTVAGAFHVGCPSHRHRYHQWDSRCVSFVCSSHAPSTVLGWPSSVIGTAALAYLRNPSQSCYHITIILFHWSLTSLTDQLTSCHLCRFNMIGIIIHTSNCFLFSPLQRFPGAGLRPDGKSIKKGRNQSQSEEIVPTEINKFVYSFSHNLFFGY